MYESPKLVCIGEAKDVILGAMLLGTDIDTTQIIHELEFAGDEESSDSAL